MDANDQPPKPGLKPWVLPLAIGSACMIGLGVLATYANTTIGAGIVLIGLIGVAVVGWSAADS